MLLDPDPHSQYGSGSKTAKWMRTHADSDPQHWFKIILLLKLQECEQISRYKMVTKSKKITRYNTRYEYVSLEHIRDIFWLNLHSFQFVIQNLGTGALFQTDFRKNLLFSCPPFLSHKELPLFFFPSHLFAVFFPIFLQNIKFDISF